MMKKTLLAALLATPLAMLTIPAAAAGDSEAMERERSLNRILVAERQQREREVAARGNGLIAMNTLPVAAKSDKPAADKAKPKKKAGKKKSAGKPAKAG